MLKKHLIKLLLPFFCIQKEIPRIQNKHNLTESYINNHLSINSFKNPTIPTYTTLSNLLLLSTIIKNTNIYKKLCKLIHNTNLIIFFVVWCRFCTNVARPSECVSDSRATIAFCLAATRIIYSDKKCTISQYSIYTTYITLHKWGSQSSIHSPISAFIKYIFLIYQ